MNLFDLFAKISLDTSEYSSGISGATKDTETLQDAMSDVSSESETTQGDIDDLGATYSEGQGHVEGLTAALIDSASESESASDGAQTLADNMESVGSDADAASSETSRLGSVLDSVRGDFENVGESSTNAFDSMAAMEGASFIIENLQNITSAALEMAESVGTSTAIIAEGTGATGDALSEFQSQASNAFTSVADSSQDLDSTSSALAELNTRWGLTGDELDAATEKTLQYAKVTGTDATVAVDDLAGVMKRWGLESSDMDATMDSLVVASQMSGQSVSELSSALSDGSVSFSELGLSMDESLAYMAAWANNGANLSSITTGMRQAVNNLSEAGGDVPSNFQAAIKTIQNTSSASEALNSTVGDTGLTIKDMFGSKAAQEIVNAVQGTGTSFDEMSAAISGSNGALEQTYEDSITTSDQLSQLSNSFSQIAQNSIAPVLSGVATALNAIITPIANLIQNSTAAQTVFTALAAAVGVFVVALTGMLIVKQVTSAMDMLGVSLTSLAANPVVLIIAAIAALVTAFIYLWNNCESFKNFFVNAWNTITTAAQTAAAFLSSAWETISTAITTVMNTIWSVISTVWNSISTVISTVMAVITAIFTGDWSSIGKIVSKAVKSIKNTISNIMGSIKSKITSILSNIVSSFTGKFSSIGSKVTSALKGIKTKVVSWGSEMVSKFLSIGKDLIKGMWDGISNKAEWLKDQITGLGSKITNAVKKLFGISSPSKVFAEIGGYMAEGLGVGWANEIDAVKKDIEGDLDFGTVSTEKSTLGTIASGSGSNITVVQNIYSKAQTAADLLREAKWQQERAVLQGV